MNFVGCFAIYQPRRYCPFSEQAGGVGPELRRAGGDSNRERAVTRGLRKIHSSNRLPPPMCSRSSAGQYSICRPCSTLFPKSAARLCDAEHAWLFRRVGDTYQWAASYGHSSENHERIKIHMLTRRLSPGRGSVVGRAVLEGRPVQIVDVLADPEYEEANAQKLARFRTTFAAPLLRQGEPIGAIALQRTVVKPFTEKQVELVQIFADQAVIAMENVRLFDEVPDAHRRIWPSLFSSKLLPPTSSR